MIDPKILFVKETSDICVYPDNTGEKMLPDKKGKRELVKSITKKRRSRSAPRIGYNTNGICRYREYKAKKRQ